MRRLAWYLAPAAVLLGAFPLVRDDGLLRGLWLLAVPASAAAAVLVGVRLERPSVRRPWHVLALALALPAAAGAVAVAYALLGDEVSFPSGADLFVVLCAPALATGLGLLAERRVPGRDWATLLDASIVTTGAAALSWTFLVAPVLADGTLSAAAKAALVGYPLADLTLLGLVAYLLFAGGLDLPVSRLLAAGTTLVLAGDTLYALVVHQGWSVGESPVDVLRAVAYVCLGAAALHPSMRVLDEPVAEPEQRLSRGRLGLLLAAVLAGTATMAVAALHLSTGALLVTVAACGALLVLVIARLGNVVASYERAVRRENVLRAGAAALVGASSREDIARVASETVLELAGGVKEAFVDVQVTRRPGLDVQDAEVVGGGEHGTALRGELRRTGSLGRAGSARTLVAPVVARNVLAGLVRVTGRHAPAWSLRQAVQTIASQVALALESVQLADEVLERRSAARFRTLVQNSNDLIAVLERDLTVRYVTPSVQVMLGYEARALVGSRLDELLHPDEAVDTAERLRSGEATHEFRLRHHEGHWRTVEGVLSNLLEDVSVQGLVLTAHDVTERRALEEELTRQAFHDALTGLPNRALFADRVTHALERLGRSYGSIGVLFFDIDDFKTVNDSLGHVAGDEFLVEVAARLRSCLRSADTAARLGGDEFALLLEDSQAAEGAAAVAERILSSLAEPILIGGTAIHARASIGIVLGESGQSAGELLRNADVAMYRAKKRGGNGYEMFEPQMHEAALTRLELKADLERAFHGGELDLHYQPLVDLADGRPLGFEALLRWTHPERGPVSPLEFVRLAEETGLIVELGDWVLRRACRQAREWQSTLPGCEGLTMSVNLSGRQLQHPEFLERMKASVLETGLHPAHLVLEITESTLMEDVESVAARLAELKALGVRIAIDDFGTGFSSLSYLQRFPVDMLKIAREFVEDVVRDSRRARLVQAIVKLAVSLDLTTVAEGIEDGPQHERLRDLGCVLGQGYHFARPMPAADVPGLLREQLAVTR